MPHRLRYAILAMVIALVALTGLDTGTVFTPSRLEAQGCGAFQGKLCQSECTRECTSGGCCSWSYYYYSTPVIE